MDTLNLWLGLPDWKKISWHLGKKLNDVFHGVPSDTGPSKEERLAQRRQDMLKGFAYFDSFQELEDWLPEHADHIQIANTPLLQRSGTVSHHGDELKTSKIILCHDYKGGYHDYESVRPVYVGSEDYSCEYLQYIDTVIYFSHKLVCVPPPTWTNTLHRNGVKVLGTFIVEPQSPDVDRILLEADGDFHVAKQLACIADTFGFDGWLLNLEKEFSEDTVDCAGKLTKFIQNLKKHLGEDKQVIWYDALTIDNKVRYQNGLTEKNETFVRAADGLFTNYEWTAANVFEARRIAKKDVISTESIFFGIDVWAQNRSRSRAHRVTHPPEGGGGTTTGVAVNTLANFNFSTAIFAPAWTFEHFWGMTKDSEHAPPPGRLVEQYLWEGAELPKDIQCYCKKGITQHTMEFKNYPLLRHGREYAAGSSTFFETAFKRAYQVLRPGITSSYYGDYTVSQLGAQSTLPHLLPMPRREWEKLPGGPFTQVIYGKFVNDLLGGLIIYTKISGLSAPVTQAQAPAQTPGSGHLCLFNLNMPTDTSLIVRLLYQRPHSSRTISTRFYLAYRNPGQSGLSYTYHDALNHATNPSRHIFQEFPVMHQPHHLPQESPVPHLVELGIITGHIFNHYASPPLPVLTLHRISIIPATYQPPVFTITNLRTATRGTPPYTQKRLVWDIQSLSNSASPSASDERDSRVPWSKTTGPFSHFIVQVGIVEIGTVGACEFPLKTEDLEGGGVNGMVEVRVVGIKFEGQRVDSEFVKFGKGEFGWEIVEEIVEEIVDEEDGLREFLN
ncbi:MAG: hypothetical protein M1830_002922 [Pleopsidium flavum]|nr:MAG: hypothetical protein M1830_002922 [Pleopsidium flavum]